jgi:hypothetical protein
MYRVPQTALGVLDGLLSNDTTEVIDINKLFIILTVPNTRKYFRFYDKNFISRLLIQTSLELRSFLDQTFLVFFFPEDEMRGKNEY